MDKKTSRVRRATKTRVLIRKLNAVRLTVHRTPRHIYAQLISKDGATVITTASTVMKSVSDGLKSTGNIEAARKVGLEIAQRAQAAGIKNVAFDRSGFKYHGRIKALADAAREGGLEF